LVKEQFCKRFTVEDLLEALEREELRLYYQPKLDFDSGKIEGVEALIRWEHPERGDVFPFEFIPLAEQTGLIQPIGEWVLHTACKQNKAWMASGVSPIIMAVNLSVSQLYQPNFVERVQQILEETGLAPEYLELEITESIMMDDSYVLPVLQGLKRIGVRISLDDFGTGYRSLYYLKEFPIDTIKIGQTFVENCTVDSKDAAIVKAIIAMAHQLNVEVIAEGIESKNHLVFLQQNLCQKGQGHLFSKPLSADEFVQRFDEIEQIVHREGIPRESECSYRLIVENTPDLIRVLDTKGIIRYASPSHQTVLGFPSKVYEGKLYFDLVHPDDMLHIQKEFSRLILSKKPRCVEFRCKDAQGGWVYVEAKGAPILDEQGEVQYLVVIARDISERKNAEELILKSERLSVVGKMAAGVAHEIRNPLTSIKGFVQLLQHEVDKPFYFGILLSEIRRLEEIVKGFLTLARPQNSQMQKIDGKILLQEMLVLFGTQAMLKKVEIIEEYHSGLPPIYCDANQIKQVFIHILQNAAEAMPNGGIIKIQTLWHDSNSIKFRFTDQGFGISEERMKHIGEPFFSTKEKGTGLGLMVSQKIVQEHCGKIRIESTVNQGTTVDVILPIKQPFVVENKFFDEMAIK
jgi:PAS domain S-box-containing protein